MCCLAANTCLNMVTFFVVCVCLSLGVRIVVLSIATAALLRLLDWLTAEVSAAASMVRLQIQAAACYFLSSHTQLAC